MMSADDPTVEASDVTSSDLAGAKAAINDFRARYRRGEISPAEMERAFVGAPRPRDDPDAAGVLFVDELSSTDLVAAQAGLVPESEGHPRPPGYRLTTDDSRVIDMTWSSGFVHLYIDGKEAMTMDIQVAVWLAGTTLACAEAAKGKPGYRPPQVSGFQP